MSLLSALNRAGALRTLDHALATSLRRLDPSTPDPVLAAAALASLAVAQGHAGFDPARPQWLVDADLDWPVPQAWLQALAASPWVATPDAAALEAPADVRPLVLENGLLYLRRYRQYEARLAGQLRRIGARSLPDTGIEAVAPLFARLFPQARQDQQARAAALALRRALLLVTGGPGTGPTTTIARLLLLRIAQARATGVEAPRIALAAPTGRAADRMAESLGRARARLGEDGGVDAALLAAMPDQAQTLHRLLGPVPGSSDFRHHADNPLPLDIVVVDEASMVDLPMMCKLVEAIADGSQLVLLGDPDQLPSVEAGDVLAAILAAAGPGDVLLAEDAAALAPLLGTGEGPVPVEPGGLRGRRVHLQHGWRQDAGLRLAPLADAVRGGDAAAALGLLRSDALGAVRLHEGVADPLQSDEAGLFAHWRALATAPDPDAALAQGGRLRLLTALREGPQGSRALNGRIEALLSGSRIGTPPAWLPGRLLLVTENSYRHGLFNGDVGVCLADGNGTPLAWFPGGSEGVRAFHPAALPAHESAFAMTVHKAQGSEFDQVWLQLPARDNRVLSRELVYTGITRARRELHLAASAAVLEAALSRHARRVSGLAWRLQAGAGP